MFKPEGVRNNEFDQEDKLWPNLHPEILKFDVMGMRATKMSPLGSSCDKCFNDAYVLAYRVEHKPEPTNHAIKIP